MALTALVAGNGVTDAAVTNIDTGLSGVWENPPVNSPGNAIAHFTFDDSTRVLTYSMTVSGFSPNLVTAAHIHRGAIGVNGPVIYTLSDKGFTSVSGQITLTDADVADLKAGNLYVNVHSTAFPSGFARGQIFLNPADTLTAGVKAILAAYDARDFERLAVFFTDAGFESLFEQSKADARAHLDQFFQGPAPTFVSLTDVTVDGSTARSTLTTTQGTPSVPLLNTERVDWVFGGGLWLVAHDQQIDTPIPAGARTVNVRLVNFAFDFDKTAVTSGVTVFHFTNAGTEEHEAVFVKVNADKALDAIAAELLQGGPDAPPPPYIDFIAQNAAEPGGEFSFVLTKPLPAGRYAFFCFEPDPASGQPHVALGMRSEFTVGAATGTGVLPPNTGDAGLKGEAPASSALYAAASAMLVFAFGVATSSAHKRRA